ncbi:hypothetical protein SNE40_020445 [Patella caerulea]|uniref:Uncharacterized protein n=1 Tax=Patella caerulea TaxID=87958 RepID=A0AAN8GK09_PATCE
MDAFTSIKRWFKLKLDDSPFQQILSARRLREHRRKYHIHGGNVHTPDDVQQFVVPARHVANKPITTDLNSETKSNPKNMQKGSMAKAKQTFGDLSLYFDDPQFTPGSPSRLGVSFLKGFAPDKYPQDNRVSTSSSILNHSAPSSVDIRVVKRTLSGSSVLTPLPTAPLSTCSPRYQTRRTRPSASSCKRPGERLVLSSSDDAMITTGPATPQGRRPRSYSCGKDCKRIGKNVIRHSSPSGELGDLTLFGNTNSDPQSAAAMSLGYLATKTCYGFSTLTEPPTYGRRESLFHS